MVLPPLVRECPQAHARTPFVMLINLPHIDKLASGVRVD
jgi:hypothetical protein